MKVLTRALMALFLTLGLMAGPSAPAQADSTEPIWQWGDSFNCQTGDTVTECAYAVVLRYAGAIDYMTGKCAHEAQAPEYCDRIASDEKTWLWRPIVTWELAQAVLRGYEQVTQNPDVLRSEFTVNLTQNLFAAAQARVANMFDPVTHEYKGAYYFSRTYAPTVSGSTKVGKTLTAGVRSWSPSVTAKAWQWQRNGVAIPGATSYKYKLVADDLGTTISVVVTGSRAGYKNTARTSKATRVITKGTITRGTVKVTGTRRVGRTLTASTSKWTSGVTFTYQWYRNKRAVAGATAKTYVLAPRDLGKRFTVKVRASKPGYYTPASKTTKRTGKIKRGLIIKVTPSISGIVQRGETLTVTPGAWKPASVRFGYQWYRNDRKISGATGPTYLLKTADLGRTIKVKVTGKAAGYNTTYRYSARTVKVVNPPTPEPPPTTP